MADEERRRDALTKEDVLAVFIEAMQSHEEREVASMKSIMHDAFDRHMLEDSHAFVKTLIVKEQRRQELWENTRKHVIGWGAVAVIMYLLSLTWDSLLSHIK